jgi:hypothetical protein
MAGDLLITIASWEERFAAGVERSLGLGGVDCVLCLASERYEAETLSSRERVAKACKYSEVSIDARIFDFEDQVSAFREIRTLMDHEAVRGSRGVILDISTAPRSTVWLLLSALRRIRRDVVVRYNKALEYGDWQTAEEGEPKLIINQSGIMYPDCPTCVVMLCGPEISRAEKLCYRFEPKKALVLRDPLAAQFGEVRRLPLDHGDVVVEHEFDNKDLSDGNMDALEALVAPYLDTHNVVAASFGPKLGALVLFEFCQRHPRVALSYVTSGLHNPGATRGIGDMSDLRINLDRDGRPT